MHKLAARATRLSRRVYASLPLSYRVAQLVLKLSVGPQEAHGIFFYGIFVKAGIEGLPDIDGRPALEFRFRKKKIHELVKRLRQAEPGYGKSFGGMLWGMAVKRYGYEVAEDAISWMTEKLADNPGHIRAGFRLSQAESWVMSGVKKRAVDMLKRKYRTQEKSLTRIDEGGEAIQRDVADPGVFKKWPHRIPFKDPKGDIIQRDMADPGTLEEMLQKIAPQEIKRMKRRLRTVDRKKPKRAEQFIRMVLNDETQKEMALAWGMSEGRVSGWIREHRKRIWNILKEYLIGVPA